LVHRELQFLCELNQSLGIYSESDPPSPVISFIKLVFILLLIVIALNKLARVYTIVEKPPNLGWFHFMLLS
jgi:hypothetical protein